MKQVTIFTLALLFMVSPAFAQSAAASPEEGFRLMELAIRFALNAVSIFILVRLIYFIRHRNKDFQFTLMLFNCVNFLLCYLLAGAQLEIGFAFGLFAIFSIMRYRTVTVPVKEMGYLFLSVAMGLINSLAASHDNYIVLICSNAFLLLLALMLDRSAQSSGGPKKDSKQVIYERIDLIKPEKQTEMLEDLRERTGLNIFSVEVLSIDLTQDMAIVKANYYCGAEDAIMTDKEKSKFLKANSREKLVAM